MPLYRISVTNTHYDACEEQELPSPEAARQEAIKSALQLGIEEVDEAQSFFAAEIRIDEGDRSHGRYIVAIGVSPLK